MTLSIDEKLDEALRETFPASDPFSLSPGVPYLSLEELGSFLNALIEGERAGARGVKAISRGAAQGGPVLDSIAADEAHFCRMLIGHVEALGIVPSTRTSEFHAKLCAVEDPFEQLELLNRGQRWVVRKISEALPRIAKRSLREDLERMRDAHVLNVARCSELAAAGGKTGLPRTDA
jgi:nitronate monooxygenase